MQGSHSQNSKNYLVVIVGDSGSGKSEFLRKVLKHGEGAEDFGELNFYDTDIKMKLEGEKISFQLFLADSGVDLENSSRDLSQLREKQRIDGYIVFFAVDNRQSFEDVEKWVNVIRAIDQKSPIFLVANKSDLRENAPEGTDLVTQEEIK